MKHYLYYAPVLTLRDLQKPFDIETESTKYDIGVVLTQ